MTRRLDSCGVCTLSEPVCNTGYVELIGSELRFLKNPLHMFRVVTVNLNTI